jgi:branched-chain amino acid aminotransferase
MIRLASGYTGDWLFLDNLLVKAQSTGERKNSFINSVYEVVRVTDTVPVFIEDHYQRFENSVKSFGLHNYPVPDELKKIISDLCVRNGIKSGNLRFEIYFDETSSLFALYQIPHFYPSVEMYNDGVKLVSFQIERPNPHIKQSVVNSEVRSRISDIQQKTEAYEIVLVNYRNEITEGSKSNIFFVSNRTIYSPPSEVILEGITRKRLLMLVQNYGIQFIEKPVSINKIKDFEGCFLTGTSPKILPVSIIDTVPFNPAHALILELINLFNLHVNEYCLAYK